MATFTPSPRTWTLRLKAHKTTVFVHVDPLHSFASIKAQLYHALQETSLRHGETLEVLPLPDSPEDIQFGCPVNASDISAGFVLGQWEYRADEDELEGAAKTRGKAKAKGKAKAGDEAMVLSDHLEQCPKGAGLKDGAVLAFRWKGDGQWDYGREVVDDEGVSVDADTADTLPRMWGVKLSSFEEG